MSEDPFKVLASLVNRDIEAQFEEAYGKPLDEVLAERELHIVTFTETGYGLQHPWQCRPSLLGCPYNQWLAEQDAPARTPGRWVMSRDDGPFEFRPA